MKYTLLSNLIVIVHLLFIIFVCLGALLALKWRKIVWIHIPLAIWGIVVEYLDIVCPLTPLENYFRQLGGSGTYNTDFIDRYILPIMYPAALNRNTQFLLGTFVIVINLVLYSIIIYRSTIKRKSGG
jgi:hypothetical protein